MTLSKLSAPFEAAGVPHSDISIVANNRTAAFHTDKKLDRDHDEVDDRAEGAGKAQALAQALRRHRRTSCRLGLLAIPDWDQLVAARLARRDGGWRGSRGSYWRYCRCAHRSWRFGSGCSLLRRGRPTRRHAGVSARGRFKRSRLDTMLDQFAVKLAGPKCCLAESRMEIVRCWQQTLQRRGGPEGTRVVRRWPSLSKH